MNLRFDYLALVRIGAIILATGTGAGAQTAQTITFPGISNQGVRSTIALGASASSGLAVSYTITGGSSIASISSGAITLSGIGSVTVEASQAGNGTYAAAPTSYQTFSVTAQPPAIYTQVAAGWYYSVGIRSDGTLWTWGDNSTGELGDGTTVNHSTPEQIGSAHWTAVAAHFEGTTLAIRSDGTLWAWGRNDIGQVGDGTTVQRLSPVQIGIGQTWIAIAEGEEFSVAIRSDGTLWAWGANYQYQLGDGTTTSQSSPEQIGIVTTWKSVSAGIAHVIALRQDGSMWGWGYSPDGETGTGTVTDVAIPTQIAEGTQWKAIGTEFQHSLAIKTDGTLWAWGANYEDQLGDGTTVNHTTPEEISTMTSWTTVATGAYASYALVSNGMLYAWGTSSSGQVGNGTTTTQPVPQPIGTSYWRHISGGIDHALGIQSSGYLYAWGGDTSGQLGDGGNTQQNAPESIFGTMPYSWISLAQGLSSTLAVRSDGTLWGWGLNTSEQFGDGTETARPVPSQIGTTAGWAAVAMGQSHAVGLKTNGTLWTWGNGELGALGNGSTAFQGTATQVGTATWKAIAATANDTLAIRSDGTLWGSGLNSNSELGDGTTNQQNSLEQIGTANTWQSIAGGANHVVALQTSGTLWAWGSNQSGQIGNGTTINQTRPLRIGISAWKAIGAGYSHTLAISTTGALWEWGYDTTSVLGFTPVQIGTATNWTSVAGGEDFSNALRSDGTRWGWGRNSYGILGDGTSTVTQNTPEQIGSDTTWTLVALSPFCYVSSGAKNDASLLCWGSGSSQQLGYPNRELTAVSPVLNSLAGFSMGYDHVVALKTDGTVWAWGENLESQVGNGTQAVQPTPVQVATNMQAVAAGNEHNLAIAQDGSLWGWGDNSTGQLGDGTGNSYTTPRQINSATNWKFIAAGAFNSLAIRTDGSLWGTGYNYGGELGDGTTTLQYSFEQIGTATDWKSVATSNEASAGIKTDGTLWTWGDNSQGELGDGTNVAELTPEQIGTATNWKSVAVSDSFIVAVQTNGTLWVWGGNSYGQLGDGTYNNHTTPEQVGSATNWVAAQAGPQNVIALRSDGTLWAWGGNSSGQLGDGTTNNEPTPEQIGTSAAWSMLPMGMSESIFTLATTVDGTLWACGDDSDDERADPVANYLQPERVYPLATSQTVIFPAVSGNAGSQVPLAATASSGLPVTYAASGPATISGTTLTVTGTGTVNLVAYQTGDSNWGNSGPSSQSFTSGPAALNVTFTSAVSGGIAANGYTASGLTLNLALSYAPAPSDVLTVINNTSGDAISGTFSNLPDGGTISATYNGTTYYFVANYEGGDGNDLTLSQIFTPTFSSASSVGSTVSSFTATGLTLSLNLAYAPSASDVLTVINNIGSSPITGNFSNLADGGTITASYNGTTYTFQANYEGGTGNDLTLSLVNPDYWTGVAPMPTARWDSAVGVFNGQIYVAGGYNNNTRFDYENQVFNPATNTWISRSNVPFVVNGSAARAYNGKLYCADGTDTITYVSAMRIYDPSTDTWTNGASSPVALSGARGDFINGLMYVAGGVNTNGPQAFLQIYNPASDSWTEGAPLPTPRFNLGVIAVNGILYTIGGQDQNGYFNTVEAYNPSTYTWTTMAPMPTARCSLSLAAIGTTIYAIGGSNGTALPVVEAYDTVKNVWRTAAPLTINAAAIEAAVVNNTIYVIGGYDQNNNGVSLTEYYTASSSIAPSVLDATFASATSVGTTSSSFTATGATLELTLNYAPATSDVLTVINNTGSNPIIGTFTNLPDGGEISPTYSGGTYNFIANYEGGDGNDLTLSTTFSPQVFSASSPALTTNGFNAFGLTLALNLQYAPSPTDILTVVNNTGGGAIVGNFINVPDGGPVTATYNGTTYNFIAHYEGGDGNDLTLSQGTSVTFGSATSVGITTPGGYRPTGPLSLTLTYAPSPSDVLTVINNTGGSAINGTFSNLPDGGEITATYNGTTYYFIANYEGGDGNDLTLNSTVNATITSPSNPALSVGSYSANGLTLALTLDYAPSPTDVLTVIHDTGGITGTFANLPEGGTISAIYNGTTYNFIATYLGGTGHDLTLTGTVQATFASVGTARIVNGFNATGLNLALNLTYAPQPTDVLTVINNTSGTPIGGNFVNLPDQSEISATYGGTTYNFFANYEGGDGNDLTLSQTVTPTFSSNGIGVTASGFTATGLTLTLNLTSAPTAGTVLIAVNNTGPDPIEGTFSNLPDGGTITATYGGTTYTFLASYSGGSGNDLTLTYTPPAPPAALTILHNFGDGTAPNDGVQPQSLTPGSDGNFYGVTTGTGSLHGTVFRITPQGQTTILHVFGDGSVTNDGLQPSGPLTLAPDGSFYGTTQGGGTSGQGTLYKVNTQGHVTILTSFGGATPASYGSTPAYGVTAGSDGNFYCVTTNGSESALLQLTPAGALSFVANLSQGVADSPLTLGADGNLYGLGGTGNGFIYQLTTLGQQTVIHSFNGTPGDGNVSSAGVALIQGLDGNFYGTAKFGGTTNFTATGTLADTAGAGVAFKVSPQGQFTVLHTFNDGSVLNDGVAPFAPLTLASDGNFYGSTIAGGSAGEGTLFRMTPQGVTTILHSFGDGTVVPDGSGPQAGAAQGSDGNLYGSTAYGGSAGGTPGNGTLYKFNLGLPVLTSGVRVTGTAELPFSYQATGSNQPTNYAATNLPTGLVINPSTGLISGTVETTGTTTATLTLTNTQGSASTPLTITMNPLPAPVISSLLSAYGTVGTSFYYQIGANNNPTNYGASVSTLPPGLAINTTTGVIYGTPTTPGTYNTSISATNASNPTTTATLVIQVTTTTPLLGQEYVVLHRFTGAPGDGAEPTTIFQGFDGTLYGSTTLGGADNSGSIFNMTLVGTTTTVSGTGYGGRGVGLVQASDSNFYGTAAQGGSTGSGYVFKVTHAGVKTILHTFGDGTVANDGATPSTGLIQGFDGNLYGTTTAGGAHGVGTVFQISTVGVMTILHSFGDTTVPNDGAAPTSGLVEITDDTPSGGTFYGTTQSGGQGSGVVYSITASGTVTILHSFGDGSVMNDGIPGAAAGAAPLVAGFDGNLYSTTSAGGSAGKGVIYSISKMGTVTILHSFGDGSVYDDGAAPLAGVIQGFDGSFYGTTSAGGANGSGTIFQVTGAGTLVIIHSFGDSGYSPDGTAPTGPLYQGGDGNFYGTTSVGGTGGNGTVFALVATQPVNLPPVFIGSSTITAPIQTPFSYTPKVLYAGPSGSGGSSGSIVRAQLVGVTGGGTSSGGYRTADATSWSVLYQNGNHSNAPLPSYLTFDNTSGTFTGNVQQSGTYTFNLTVTNSNNQTSSKIVTMYIDVAPAFSGNYTYYGTVGQPIAFPLVADAAPTSYGADTSLPSWLHVDPTYGTVSGGNPPASGTFTFNATATNPSGTTAQPYNVIISAPVTQTTTPTITSPATTTATVGVSFSYQITAPFTGAQYHPVYQVGNLPSGFSVSSNGLIQGTFPTVGNGTVVLPISVSNNTPASASMNLSVAVSAISAPAITSATSLVATEGSLVYYQIQATNLAGAFTCSPLPTWLSLTSPGGLLYGTPPMGTASSTPIVLTLTASNTVGTGPSILSVLIQPQVDSITSPLTANATINSNFAYQITASNASGVFTASSSNLPPGLSLTDTGAIIGVPTITGTYYVPITEGVATAQLVITVALPPAPVINSPLAVTAPAGTPFSYQITATNSPVVFEASPSPLPVGLSLSGSVISGTPTAAGTYTIILIVHDNNGQQDSKNLVLTLTGEPIINSPTTVFAQTGMPFSYQITASPAATGYSATGLPAGLTLSTTQPGLISGTPTAANTLANNTVTLSAINSLGIGTQAINLYVAAAQTLSQWQSANDISTSSNPALSTEDDGVPDILKYLTDVKPSVPMQGAAVNALPAVGMMSLNGMSYLTLTYRQYGSELGITVIVQTSSDLINWTTVNPPDYSQTIGVDSTTGDPIMQVGVKMNSGTKQYIRLHVSQ